VKLLGYIAWAASAGESAKGYISPVEQRDSIGRYATERGGTITDWLSDASASKSSLGRGAETW